MFAIAIASILLFPAKDPQKTTLVFGGDIMLNQIPVAYKPLAALKPLFQSGTVGFANLEIPLTDAKSATPFKSGAELKARTQFILKADPKHIANIKAAGIDMVSLANNHAMDYRAAGLRQEIGLLDKAGILHAGAGPNLEEAKEIAGKDNVFLASALGFMGAGAINKLGPATDEKMGIHALFFNGSINQASKTYLKAWIHGPRSNDEGILVVAIHWGIERQTVPTAYQVSLARACIDAGADVVWGHHPHVLQGAELYKGKPILYSMGNLISKKEGPTGLVRLYFEDFKFKKFKFLPLTISGMRTKVVPDDQVPARQKGYKALSMAIQKRYPNKNSKPLF